MNLSKKTGYILILFILFFIENNSYGQRWKLRRYEVGGGIGACQVFGDIGGTADANNLFGLKDINLSETRYGLTGIIRYKISPIYTVKASLLGAYATGNDENSKNNRGREYRTVFFEFSGHFEYYFVQEEKTYRSSGIYNRRGMLNNYSHYAFYGFAGIGAVYSISHHNYPSLLPQDHYKNGSNIGPVIPFGIGTKLILNSRYSVNAEFGYRYMFSDYLEGYKNDYSKHNDVYYFLNLTVTYRLKTTTRNIPAIIDKRYKQYGY